MPDPFFVSDAQVVMGILDWVVELPVEWGVTGARSNVLAAVTELNQNGLPFIGNATIAVQNVVPQDNSVLVRVTTNLPEDELNVRLALVIWP